MVTNMDIAADHAHVPATLTALLTEYAHCIDSDQIEAWPSLFTDPCLYKITTRDNLARGLPACLMLCDSRGMLMDRVVSIRRANVFEPHCYRHMVSCIRVTEAEADAWRLQSNYLVIRTMLDGSPWARSSPKRLSVATSRPWSASTSATTSCRGRATFFDYIFGSERSSF